jgi:hypothetical protein
MSLCVGPTRSRSRAQDSLFEEEIGVCVTGDEEERNARDGE